MHHRLFALAALNLVLACSSDPASPSGNGSAGAPSAGAAGALAGAGGAPAAGAPATNGGAGAAGASATAGAGGSVAGAAGASAGSTGMACPADATFCSGFEDSALPTGAVYKANAAPGEWTRDFAVDTTVYRGGKSSVRVKDSTEAGVSGAYRMLAVPAPTSGAFWVRFYIRQDELDIGGKDHNVFASAALGDDPNVQSIEFAEDVGVSFNTSDQVRWPMGYGRLTGGGEMPYTLPKGTWHCIEIQYDGQARAQKLYIEGALKIDTTDYPAAGALNGTLKNFKFGFNQLHGPSRKVWYDDVAVGPTRAGCL